MIPLRDVIPSRTTPYITVTIIGLNAIAWLFELGLASDVLPVFLQVYGLVPAHFNAPTLVTWIFLLGFWFLMQLFSAGAIAVTSSSHGGGGVAFAAHVAGFLCGVGGVFVFRKREEPDTWWA